MCTIREYTATDYNACLSVFDSNVPSFFAKREQSAYAAFLLRRPCPYLVAQCHDEVVAGGGYYRLDDTCAGLTWGIVARDHQSRGIGGALLRERLRRLAADSGVRRVRVKTSQLTAPFFEKFGFQTARIFENHFGSGLHQYEMFLQLA